MAFSHGWPLSADSGGEAQMVFLASSGYRCIAHDRRRPWPVEPALGWRWTPMPTTSRSSSKLVKNATLKIYSGHPSASRTHKDQLNANLLAFLKT
jgi:non-heme chloroperoxidase